MKKSTPKKLSPRTTPKKLSPRTTPKKNLLADLAPWRKIFKEELGDL